MLKLPWMASQRGQRGATTRTVQNGSKLSQCEYNYCGFFCLPKDDKGGTWVAHLIYKLHLDLQHDFCLSC